MLAAEHNADNAKVLFDHVDVTAPGVISEAMASRWILATQTFSVSSGKSELAHTGSAPSAISEMVIPLGASLQDTLLFSLVPQNRDIVPSDIPVWERYPESVEDLKSGLMRPASGLADLYTWRTRSIRLIPDESGVSRLALASGVKHQAGTQIDPMVGYRIDAKKGKTPPQVAREGSMERFRLSVAGRIESRTERDRPCSEIVPVHSGEVSKIRDDCRSK